jgi:hypothetical protein
MVKKFSLLKLWNDFWDTLCIKINVIIYPTVTHEL